MVSASHNPADDNGLKVLDADGLKLDDALEDELEQLIWRTDELAGVLPGRLGVVVDARDRLERYVAHREAMARSIDASGLRIVIDCANGSACKVAGRILGATGAGVDIIHDAPDGLNINDECGSTHLDKVREAVLREGADLGIAHDGDADRCLAVDATGTEVDGDQIMAILALAMKSRGALAQDTLVTTVMSNLGLLQAMEREGIAVVQTGVGDRYVLEEMRRSALSLGGEQSGHVIFLDHGTTGDGVLTGLMLAARVAETQQPLAELASVMTRLPQVLVNVKGVDKSRVESDEELQMAVKAEEAALAGSGRVLLRKSGTEPVVRVMVEGEDRALVDSLCRELAGVVENALR